MLGTRQKVLMAVMAAALVLGNVASAAAQAAATKLIVVNDAGSGITEFVISPSREHYRGNSSCFAVEGIKESDGAAFALSLPDDMKGIGFFDIEIVAGGKKFATKKGVKIDFSSAKTPTVYLSTVEKDLTEGLKNAVPALATAAFFVTTKRIVPKAGAAVLAAALPKAGLFLNIPYLGWILAGGILIVEGAFLLYDHAIATGDLWVQVDYN